MTDRSDRQTAAKQTAANNDIATSPRTRSRYVVRGIIGIIAFLILLWIIFGIINAFMQPNNNVPEGRGPADGNLPSSLSDQMPNDDRAAPSSDASDGSSMPDKSIEQSGTDDNQGLPTPAEQMAPAESAKPDVMPLEQTAPQGDVDQPQPDASPSPEMKQPDTDANQEMKPLDTRPQPAEGSDQVDQL